MGCWRGVGPKQDHLGDHRNNLVREDTGLGQDGNMNIFCSYLGSLPIQTSKSKQSVCSCTSYDGRLSESVLQVSGIKSTPVKQRQQVGGMVGVSRWQRRCRAEGGHLARVCPDADMRRSELDADSGREERPGQGGAKLRRCCPKSEPHFPPPPSM